MKGLKLFAALVIIGLILCPFCLVNADSREGSDMKHEGSMPKGGEDMPSKPPYCRPEACMSIMLKKQEDRARIVEEILKDEATRDLLMEKIADNAELQRELMEKMKEKKHGEGSMMKHEEMMHGEGSMMKHDDMMHGEGSDSKE
jgi:hypothetical protein